MFVIQAICVLTFSFLDNFWGDVGDGGNCGDCGDGGDGGFHVVVSSFSNT